MSGKQAWLTQNADSSAILAVFNLGKDDADLSLSWKEVDSLRDTHFADGAPPVLYDLISGASVTSDRGKLTLFLPSHASRVFRISKTGSRPVLK